MSDLEKKNNEVIEFQGSQLMPHQNFGGMIDWNKVFQSNIGVFYPKPIDWKNSLSENGDFDGDRFYLNRNAKYDERKKYLEVRNEIVLRLDRYVAKGFIDELYIEENLDKLIESYRKMFFLGEEFEQSPRSEIYRMDFYQRVEELLEQIKGMNTLPENAGEFHDIVEEIKQNIEKAKSREGKKRGEHEKKILEFKNKGVSKYLDNNNKLHVDKVLEDLNSHRDWNEQNTLIAFFNGETSKDELKRLQDGVIQALDSKILKLDTYKVFIILQWVLPFIFESYEMEFNVPEIFQPEYLSKLSIRNLDIDEFTKQVESRGKTYGWNSEVQEKLIQQFKKFGTDKDGNIGFGQGSEQLRYWNGVTGGVNKDNYQHYLIDKSLLVDNLPIPRILQNIDDGITNQYSDDVKKAIE